jgi:hypothetical protein
MKQERNPSTVMFGDNFITGGPKEGYVLKMLLQEGNHFQEL